MSPTALFLLILLAVIVSVGLFAVIKEQVEQPQREVAELVAQRLQSHLGQRLRSHLRRGPTTLREIEMQQSFMERVVKPLLIKGAELLERRTPARQREALQVKIAMAGKASSLDAGSFQVIRYGATLCGLILGIIFAALVHQAPLTVLLPFGFTALGWLFPTQWLNRAAKRRMREMRRQLPDVLDLMTITVQAGLSFDAAMAKVAEHYRGSVLGEEFNQVLQETRLGKPRLEALADMGKRTGSEEVQNFVQAVIQSEQMGIGIGKILRLQADDLRRVRIQYAKIKASRSAIVMLLPMVGCILPTLFIIILGPTIFILMRSHA